MAAVEEVAVEALDSVTVAVCECRVLFAPAFSLSLGVNEDVSTTFLLLRSCNAFPKVT